MRWWGKEQVVGERPDGGADKYQLPHLPQRGLMESVDQVIGMPSCPLMGNPDAINSLTSGEVISYSEVRFLTCE